MDHLETYAGGVGNKQALAEIYLAINQGTLGHVATELLADVPGSPAELAFSEGGHYVSDEFVVLVCLSNKLLERFFFGRRV